jgi:hypothetical protein
MRIGARFDLPCGTDQLVALIAFKVVMTYTIELVFGLVNFFLSILVLCRVSIQLIAKIPEVCMMRVMTNPSTASPKVLG